MTYVNQTLMPYTLNLYSDIGQLLLNKMGKIRKCCLIKIFFVLNASMLKKELLYYYIFCHQHEADILTWLVFIYNPFGIFYWFYEYSFYSKYDETLSPFYVREQKLKSIELCEWHTLANFKYFLSELLSLYIKGNFGMARQKTSHKMSVIILRNQGSSYKNKSYRMIRRKLHMLAKSKNQYTWRVVMCSYRKILRCNNRNYIKINFI